MRSLFVPCAGVVLVVIGVCNGVREAGLESPKITRNQAAPDPRLLVQPSTVAGVSERKHIPFVIVGDDPHLGASFEISNSTNRVMKLGTTRQSCGCTQASLDKTVLSPGERAKLDLSVSMAGRNGAQRFVCEVPVDDAAPKSIELTTVAFPKHAFEPESLHFQTVEAGGHYERRVLFAAHAKSDDALPMSHGGLSPWDVSRRPTGFNVNI